MMEKINNNPTLKNSLEGAGLLVALIGTLYLGQNITKIEFADISNALEASQTANLIDSTKRNDFSGYEYVLIDNSKGIREIKTR